MKKFFLLAILVSIFSFSCDSDDDTSVPDEEKTPTETASIVRISLVDTAKDEVTLINLGGKSVNISGYFLCLGPGTYREVGTITTADTNLANGESITLSYDMNPDADGLSVFTTNSFSSSDPSILIDYVQWGAASQARVGQAVTAGRWNEATQFIENESPYTFNGESNEFGVSFWSGTN